MIPLFVIIISYFVRNVNGEVVNKMLQNNKRRAKRQHRVCDIIKEIKYIFDRKHHFVSKDAERYLLMWYDDARKNLKKCRDELRLSENADGIPNTEAIKRFEYYHGQVVLLEDIMETLLIEYAGNRWTIRY